jgi:hypothetical protein
MAGAVVSTESRNAEAMEALLAGPFKPDALDPRAPAIHLLKRDGVPIVSNNVGKKGDVVMVHQLIETDLQPHEVKAQRGEGLNLAMKWHRCEPVSKWKGLIDSIECPFAKDEASEYLRGMIQRIRFIGGH